MRTYVRLGLLLAMLGVVLVAGAGTAASPGTTERVSVDSAGNEGNGRSFRPAISADGRYVAFESQASNLVPGDTNVCDDWYGNPSCWDIFVHDRLMGITERVSVDSAGNEGNGDSRFPAISADGRYVAFSSYASNLVLDDTNDTGDVFVHDRLMGITERVSVDSDGNEGNGDSRFPAISADGRYVAFSSYASNLVPDDTNDTGDVFVHDRQTGVTERVSVDSDGNEGNNESHSSAISADGRYVAFSSYASNLVPDDTNGTQDVFVHDRQTRVTERMSVDSAGNEGNDGTYNPAMSGDGRYVAFVSLATNLVAGDTNNVCDNNYDGVYTDNCRDVFVHDRQTGVTERVSVDSAGSEGNNQSYGCAISTEGRYVAFWSWASNLVAGDTNVCPIPDPHTPTGSCPDVFVHDRLTGVTERVSVDSDGNQGNDASHSPAISADGRYVAFSSRARNLVPGDTNTCAGGSPPPGMCPDVFVRDRDPCGNVDCDDDVDAVDALFILQYVVGLRLPSDQCPPPEGHLYLPAGDVDCDADVDAVDALFVLQHVVGSRPELCVCPEP